MKLKPNACNLAAALLLACAGSSAAAELPKDAVCALQQAVACAAYTPCERALPAAVNLPALLRFDTAAKTVESRLDDGTVRTSSVESTEAGDGALVLQGNDGGHPWAMRVDTQTGRFTLSVLRKGEGFTAFGVCSAKILQ